MDCEPVPPVEFHASENSESDEKSRRLCLPRWSPWPRGPFFTLAPHPAFVRRFELVRQYGDFTMAYATLQPGMKYFTAYGGYLAYDQVWGTTIVLGDPVAPQESHRLLIEAFVRRFPRTCFCQISKPTGAILADLGWFVNEFGADMELDLKSYDFTGPGKSKLRQAVHKIERDGLVVEEGPATDSNRAELEALSQSWRALKTVRNEARFLVRPFEFGNEPDARRFYLRNADGEIVAFITFDPMYENGTVIGYSPAIKRRSTAAPTGSEEAITCFAIEQFRREGVRTLRLGLLPFYQVEDSMFRETWVLKRFFQWAYGHGNRWIYNFRGLADFKHRFRGTLSKVYFATSTRGNAWNLIALLRVCRFIGDAPQRFHRATTRLFREADRDGARSF